MDKIFFVILLTGFFATSVSVTYYYYPDLKSWANAKIFCQKYHKDLLQDYDTFDWTTVGKSKAWTGMFKTTTWRYWASGGQPTYTNWTAGGQRTSMYELCSFMTDGAWQEHNCSDVKQSVCFNGSYYTYETTEMTWDNANTKCKKAKGFLVTIPNSTINAKVRDLLPKDAQAWIGVFKTTMWYSTTGHYFTKPNWETGQPDNYYGNEYCVAENMTDGKWTDEPCADLYPFVCNDVDKAKQSLIKLKIQTTADLKDPVVTSSIHQQLVVMLSKHDVNQFQVTWKKLPKKEIKKVY